MSRERPYFTGTFNGVNTHREGYATLAEAAEAVRQAKGWAEVHLTDEGPVTEAFVPSWTAYATTEERDSHDPDATLHAPWIYEVVPWIG